MIKLLLLRFWPALIPIILYILWRIYISRQATADDVYDANEEEAKRRSKAHMLLAISTLAMVIISFVILILNTENTKQQGAMVPSHIENGVLVPGRIE